MVKHIAKFNTIRPDANQRFYQSSDHSATERVTGPYKIVTCIFPIDTCVSCCEYFRRRPHLWELQVLPLS